MSSAGNSSHDRLEDGGHDSAAGVGGASAADGTFIDDMRAYRACLHCRSRKTKCKLDVNGGRPPCRRCHRQGRECILGESHRGGKRVRKKRKAEGEADNTAARGTLSPSLSSTSRQHLPPAAPLLDKSSSQRHYGYENLVVSSWDAPVPPLVGRPHDTAVPSRPTPTPASSRQRSQQEDFAAAELHNPSDALGILARVADSAEPGTPSASTSRRSYPHPWPEPVISENVADFAYQPIIDGKIEPLKVYELFDIFERHYHPYFPVVPAETFHKRRIAWMSKAKPHLFSAILTVASKDHLTLHLVCYRHMQSLVSEIVCGADADIEAVEALLLLSQWICERPHHRGDSRVGRGEEDRVGWMYIGTALRLGWYLGIDQSSSKGEPNEAVSVTNQKRLVWSACYMADRNVCVRLGKGFWARGPGPLSDAAASDYPTLEPMSSGKDHLGSIFRAHLALTQLFGNVHDILYSSKGNGWKEMLEGRYAKYLDDFSICIQNWHGTWGSLECSDGLKASLNMSYDYLRLYVNAFAYQATISRAMVTSAASEAIPLLDASTPDARFIYEAIDAAKSLIGRLNHGIPAETLRYMPCRYYMYIVYSAVFLYKAFSTTQMSLEERLEIRRMIDKTIDGLNLSSIGANQMGTRYAKLLELLWRKSPPPGSKSPAVHPSDRVPEGQHPNNGHPHSTASVDTSNSGYLSVPNSYGPTASGATHGANILPVNGAVGLESHLPEFNSLMYNSYIYPELNEGGNNTFSWLDLGATWTYATQNGGESGAYDSAYRSDVAGGEREAELASKPSTAHSIQGGRPAGAIGQNGMNLNAVADYKYLDGGNGLIF